MNEFGHNVWSGLGVYIDGWGAGPFAIKVRGRIYRFEDSDRFGPALLRKDGELRVNHCPAENHPFWNAYKAWVKQGRRLGTDKITCIYDGETNG